MSNAEVPENQTRVLYISTINTFATTYTEQVLYLAVQLITLYHFCFILRRSDSDPNILLLSHGITTTPTTLLFKLTIKK